VKRKRIPAARTVPESLIVDTVIPERLLEEAKRSIEADRLRKVVLCTVCKSECAPNSTENLCWVCRRLKLSAWRDSDSQMPAQE
jgi:PP-loop superfamily ATP-utilizing enzyme